MASAYNGYDRDLCEKYAREYDEVPIFRDIARPSLYALWNLSYCPEMKILDLACGSGTLTRPLKRLSGATVVGQDLSPFMIECAKGLEEKDKLGITYVASDAAEDLMKVPEIAAAAPYDLACAGWVYSYAKDYETLKKMVKNTYDVLKTGGKVKGIGANFFLSPKKISVHSKYGLCRVVKDETDKVYDGQTYYAKPSAKYGVKSEDVVCTLWTPETFAKAFEEVGFKNFQYIKGPLLCDLDTPAEFEYYADCINYPYFLLFKATK